MISETLEKINQFQNTRLKLLEETKRVVDEKLKELIEICDGIKQLESSYVSPFTIGNISQSSKREQSSWGMTPKKIIDVIPITGGLSAKQIHEKLPELSLTNIHGVLSDLHNKNKTVNGYKLIRFQKPNERGSLYLKEQI
jgi:hypothetical protein